jgi:hypothetical protein
MIRSLNLVVHFAFPSLDDSFIDQEMVCFGVDDLHTTFVLNNVGL